MHGDEYKHFILFVDTEEPLEVEMLSFGCQWSFMSYWIGTMVGDIPVTQQE